ncbi:beta-galactosidase [Paenibacillus sp. CF384]|uniref:beta-galactosidase n=1 Tax=Paenibacillus sp. CF384 TaxID=1884382 RepID=UPI00089ADE98|nr:beta-galactosidase [Paenibacillus sp. CF384]
MYFGACYYPEHWPEERWETDVKLMREAGFNLLRIGEFAWTRLERTEGNFTFEWLDRIIGMLGEAGIQVILGTPTASPPKWIMDRHPDMYKRDMYGHVRGFGTRMHYCFNNAEYPRYVRSLVGAMAERYRNNPHVIGWQIDNEFGCVDTTWCYCDTCKSAFQGWLQDKYGSVDAVNEAWGTVVWNNAYNAFEEIETPKLTVYPLHNPGYQLDFRRFSSDAVRKFMNIQVDLIRGIAPHQKITHNMMGIFNEIDYYELASTLDVSALDVYPNFPEGEPVNPYTPALHHDATRGFKGSNYWVLEFQAGTPGAHILKTPVRPGDLRRWSYQAVAHGADALLYFRWRTAVFGTEQYWHGILQHSGVPGRKYAEVKRVGEELARLAPYLEGSVIRHDAAIVRDFQNEWAFEIQPHNPGYKYMRQVKNYHRYFFEKHNGVDIISPEADFGAYRLLILPHLAIVDERIADKVYRYVENGGTVLLDFRSGTKLPDNRMRSEVTPGPFRELLGIEIDDYGIIPEGEEQQVRFAGDAEGNAENTEYAARVWFDVIENRGAEVVATFESDYFAGAPAVTGKAYGKGKAYYAGTELDRSALHRLLDRLCQESGAVPEWTAAHPEVEVAIRRQGGSNRYFVINHSASSVAIEPPPGCMDLLEGLPSPERFTLEPGGVKVLGKDSVTDKTTRQRESDKG